MLSILQRFASPADLAIIVVVLLIIFGPKRLPQVGNELGQAIHQLQKITSTDHRAVRPTDQAMLFVFLVTVVIIILLSNGLVG